MVVYSYTLRLCYLILLRLLLNLDNSWGMNMQVLKNGEIL
jgi:hypothetical protein